MAIDADGSNLQEDICRSARWDEHCAALPQMKMDRLFTRLDRSDAGLPSKLLRIEPSCNNPACWVVLGEWPTGTWGADNLAASLVDNRLAYLERLNPYSSGCWLLQVIADTGGPILNSAQPRYGRQH